MGRRFPPAKPTPKGAHWDSFGRNFNPKSKHQLTCLVFLSPITILWVPTDSPTITTPFFSTLPSLSLSLSHPRIPSLFLFLFFFFFCLLLILSLLTALHCKCTSFRFVLAVSRISVLVYCLWVLFGLRVGSPPSFAVAHSVEDVGLLSKIPPSFLRFLFQLSWVLFLFPVHLFFLGTFWSWLELLPLWFPLLQMGYA